MYSNVVAEFVSGIQFYIIQNILKPDSMRFKQNSGMKKLFLRLRRHFVLPVLHFWYARWGANSFLVMLAVLIGCLASLAAAGAHVFVAFLEAFSESLRETEPIWYLVPIVIFLPFFGIFLSFLVQRFFGGSRYAKSLSPLILALNRKRLNIPLSEVVTHLLSSGLSVGLGGSAGLEAPSVLTGAAIGANTCAAFKIDRKKRTVLLGCGAAAAISAIFDSPIAGVLFAAEVLLPSFSVTALIPMILSAAVAAVISRVIMGDTQFILALNAPWRPNAIPCYILLGIVCAFVGVYVIKTADRTGKILKQRFRTPWKRVIVGGTMLSLLLFCFPFLRGQGYRSIEMLFNTECEKLLDSALFFPLPYSVWSLLLVLIAAVLLKVIVSVLTVDSGGDGGIFAPSMFIGAFTGFLFARAVNLTGIMELQECNFVAVGMCGVFTAVMRAPMTGIFLIAEVTQSYILLVPLMIVSSISFFAAHFFEPNSIYKKPLIEANLLTDDRDQTMLQQLLVRLCVNTKYHVLHPGDMLAQVTSLVENTSEEVFPVLDAGNHLLGIVYLDKIRSAMVHSGECYHLLAFDLMEAPPVILAPEDDLVKAMQAFDEHGVEYLPVCDADRTFHGFIAKGPIFAKYRRLVKEEDDSF